MLFFICIRFLSNKSVNEIIPPLSQAYKLTQIRSKIYPNIDECLLSEISLPKSRIQYIIDIHKNDERWEAIKNRNIDDNLKDINQPLTEDERFAIALYSSNLTDHFYNGLSIILNTGTTKTFNCYFEYLRSGLDKLKPLSNTIQVYRGIKRTNDLVYYSNYKLNDIVQSTSFTSVSELFNISLGFAESYLFFNITANHNPKNITLLSLMETECEFLYPPATKFTIVKNPYPIYCYFSNSYHCYFDYDEFLKNSEDIYLCSYWVVDMVEVDEDYGPIDVVDDDSVIKNKDVIAGENGNGGNKEKKHLGIEWWGWLVIGVACGVVVVVIVWVIISFLNRRKNEMSEKDSAHEVTEADI